MGGVDWSYFVLYQDDVDKALQDLRQDVFHRGDFDHPRDAVYGLNELSNLGFFDTMNEQERRNILAEYGAEALSVLIERVGIGGLRSELSSLANASKLSSLADLEALRCLSTSGTRSILDITRLADVPASSAIVPLSAVERIRVFGTDKPTREMIENDLSFHDAIGRGQGIYIVAYRDGEPSEIFFTGYSYD